jgi:hypothetical protein
MKGIVATLGGPQDDVLMNDEPDAQEEGDGGDGGDGDERGDGSNGGNGDQGCDWGPENDEQKLCVGGGEIDETEGVDAMSGLSEASQVLIEVFAAHDMVGNAIELDFQAANADAKAAMRSLHRILLEDAGRPSSSTSSSASAAAPSSAFTVGANGLSGDDVIAAVAALPGFEQAPDETQFHWTSKALALHQESEQQVEAARREIATVRRLGFIACDGGPGNDSGDDEDSDGGDSDGVDDDGGGESDGDSGVTTDAEARFRQRSVQRPVGSGIAVIRNRRSQMKQMGPARGSNSGNSGSKTVSNEAAVSVVGGTPGGAGGGSVDVVHGNARWGEDDHHRFVALFRAYVQRRDRQRRGQGGARVELQERLAVEFPSKTRGDIAAHLEWHEGLLHLRRALKDTAASFVRRGKELMSDAAAELQRAAGEAQDLYFRLTAAAEIGKKQTKLHPKLALLKAAWAVRQAAREAEELEAQKKSQAVEAAERLAMAEKAEYDRRSVTEYRVARAHENALQVEAKAQLDALDAEERAAVAPLNAARVEIRRLKREEAIATQHLVAQQAAVAAQERVEMLQTMIANGVPYALEAEADEARLQSHTVAFKTGIITDCDLIARETERRVNPRGQVGHEPIKGFSGTQVYQNVRFKIIEQLRSAGLHNSAYAHSIISKLHVPSRPVHDVSTSAPWGK